MVKNNHKFLIYYLDRIYRIFSLFPEERVKSPISACAERKILIPEIQFMYFKDNYFCLSSGKAKNIMLILLILSKNS